MPQASHITWQLTIRFLGNKKPPSFSLKTGAIWLFLEQDAQGEDGFALDFPLIISSLVTELGKDLHALAERGLAREGHLEFGGGMRGIKGESIAIEGEVHVTDIVHMAIEIEVAIADEAVLFDA